MLEEAAEDAAHPDVLAQPGHGGFSAQMPRIHRSTRTPAIEARYRASMISSTRLFSLKRTNAGRPARAFAPSWSIRSMRARRKACGATAAAGTTR